MANPGSFLTAPKLPRATPQAVTPKATPTPMAKPSMGAPPKQRSASGMMSTMDMPTTQGALAPWQGGAMFGAQGIARQSAAANADVTKQMQGYLSGQVSSTPDQMRAAQGWQAQHAQGAFPQAQPQFNQMGGPMYPAGPNNPPSSYSGGLGNSPSKSGGTPQFQLPAWNPPSGGNNGEQPNNGITANARGNAGSGAGIPGQDGGFFGNRAIYDPNQYGSNDSLMGKYINKVLPVATFDQNNYQYAHDANEAQRRYNLDHGLAENQNQFQQSLSTRQQMSAEQQAQVAAQQWGQQFGHTSQMDMLGYGLSQGQLADQQQQTRNTGQYQQGINQNQAFANNATAQFQLGQNQNQGYANQTDRLMQGATQQYQQGINQNQNFANQTDRMAQGSTAQYQQGLIGNQANLNDAQANFWQGQNQNDTFANRATADYQRGLVNNQNFANQTGRTDVNNQYILGRGANQNQAQANTNQLQLGMGNIGVNQQANTIQQQYNQGQLGLGQGQLGLAQQTQQQQNAFLLQQLAQQGQQAGLDRQAQIQMANIGAYGRSQAPQASWAHNWG